MVTNKKIQKSSIKIEQLLTLAGLAVIIVGAISSLFYANVNQRFITELFPSIIYYLSNLVVLGGGFFVGFLATKSQPGKRQAKLFSAVCYAFLAATIYYVYELIRVIIMNDSLGSIGYPVGKYIFETGPLVALVVTGIIAFSLQSRKNVTEFSKWASWALVISFIGYQIFSLVQSLYFLVTESWTINFSDMPVWLIVASYILQPLVIVGVSYVILARVSSKLNRALYATLIGSISTWLLTVLWNFRTDASHEATTVFQSFVSIIVAVATALLILKARSASK